MTVQTKPKPEFAPGTTAALESEPRTNGQLVTQPAQVMRQSAPSSLAAALLQAQEQCQPVPLDALNARKKPYPTAEAIYAVASEALKGTGAGDVPAGPHARGQERRDDRRQGVAVAGVQVGVAARRQRRNQDVHGLLARAV